MNEIYNYDPETYHATLTHSVYVRLEGSTLRLSKPNKNISRRAVYNEPKPEVTYVSQKIYELTESKVSVPSLHLILTEYFETSLFSLLSLRMLSQLQKQFRLHKLAKDGGDFGKKNPCFTVNERHDFSFVSLRKVTPGRLGNRSPFVRFLVDCFEAYSGMHNPWLWSLPQDSSGSICISLSLN